MSDAVKDAYRITRERIAAKRKETADMLAHLRSLGAVDPETGRADPAFYTSTSQDLTNCRRCNGHGKTFKRERNRWVEYPCEVCRAP